MAVVSPTQFRSTDSVMFVPFGNTAASITTPVAMQSSQTAGHFKLLVAPTAIKLLDVQVICGAGAVTGTTVRAAYSTTLVAQTSDLTTTLGTATTPVASASTTLLIDAATTGDTDLPPTIPAGAYVGVNLISGGSSGTTIVGFVVRYRLNAI